MSLVDDLVAAKALIASPEQLDRLGIVGAVKLASPANYSAVIRALRLSGIVGQFRNHQLVLSHFDRAISKASLPSSPVDEELVGRG